MKRKLFIVTPLIVLALFAIWLAMGTGVRVYLPKSYDPISTIVTVDGKIAEPQNGGDRIKYTLKHGIGKATVRVENPAYEPFETTVNVLVGAEEVSVPDPAAITPLSVATLFYDTMNNDITNEKVFDDWVVFVATPKQGGDGLIIVGRINEDQGRWEVVQDGTVILTELLDGAPDSVREYAGAL